MYTCVAENKLISRSVREHVGVNVLLTVLTRASYTGTLDLVESRILRCLCVVECNSYLISDNAAERNLAAVSGLDSEACHNGNPCSVAVNLYLGIVTSRLFTAVVEGIERHQMKLIGFLKLYFKRVGVGRFIVNSISCRLVAVERVIKVGNAGVHGSAGKSELLLGSAEEDVLCSSLNVRHLVTGTGHFAYTDVVAVGSLT